MAMKVGVVGAGSWGTTVAALAAVNAPTLLWARRAELADQINTRHVNGDYLPDFTLPDRCRHMGTVTWRPRQPGTCAPGCPW
jgi:glycerol-3-phosphate dehydrogenase (NAD(P)+)